MKKYDIRALNELIHQNDIELFSPVVLDGFWTGYYVSSFGSLYKIKKDKIKEIKLSKDDNGYLIAGLSFYDLDGNKQRASIGIHRIVAFCFIENPDNKDEVNHIDLNKENNHKWNLEWVDRSENMLHSYRNLSHKWGEDNTQSIYIEKQIRYVCELLQANKLTKKEISDLTGVAIYTIDGILNKRKWHHISSQYKINYTVKSVNTGSIKKYKESDIRLVCKYLQDKKFKLREISTITGVSIYVVCDIKRRKTWCDISKDYTF